MQRASDRSDEVRNATRLVNRGDVKGAVRIYSRLFEEDARDWSVGNTLGDLYVRLGKADDAIRHFTVLAEHLAADGFAAKARALYRKILRIDPANVLARQRVDELEKQQVGQTSPFLQRVMETARTLRDNEPAVAPPPSTRAERERQPIEEPHATIPGGPAEPPGRIAQPESAPLPKVIASPAAPNTKAEMPRTDAEWAEEWAAVISGPVTKETAAAMADPATRPPADDTPQASTVAPAVPIRPAAPVDAAPEARQAAEETSSQMDAADEFRTMEIEADAAAAHKDFRAAAAIVEDFLAARPSHIAALEKLIELGVDGILGPELVAAQERLADACIRGGRFSQAYYIALDLIARYPEAPGHRALLDRVRAVAGEHGRTFPPLPIRDAGIAVAAVGEMPAEPSLSTVGERPPVRILRPDFSEVAQAGRSKAHVAPEKSEESPAPSGPLTDLLKDLADPERAFEEIRDGLLEEAAATAEERFAQATRHIAAQQFEEAIRELEEAMCAPHLRAPAGSRLARICREQGAAMEALTCLEWVAEMPPTSEENGHELAYELALTLEALGQHAQALGLYRELLAEVGPGYRDVEERVERLAAA